MKMTLLLLLISAVPSAIPVARAADQSPARTIFADSCRQLATAMSLQGDLHRRFVEECVRAKENVNNKGAPAGPFEAHPAC